MCGLQEQVIELYRVISISCSYSNLEDGILHRMGAEKGLISTRTHSYSQKPHFNSNKGNDIREKVKVNSYPIF